MNCGHIHISVLHETHMFCVILFSRYSITLYYSLSLLTQLEILKIGYNTIQYDTCNLQELKKTSTNSVNFSKSKSPLKCPNSPLGGNFPQVGDHLPRN